MKKLLGLTIVLALLSVELRAQTPVPAAIVTPPPGPIVAVATLNQAQAQAFITAALGVVAVPAGKSAANIVGGNFRLNSDGTAQVTIRFSQ